MFDNKKFLLLLTTAALVAACGGGGGTPTNTLPDGGGSGGGDTGGNNGGNNGGGDDGGDGGNDGGDGGDPVVDQSLPGRTLLVGNSLLYVRGDRTMYLPVTLERLEDPHGINDVAPGFTGNEEIGPPYRPEDGIDYAPPQTLAPAAPIAAFGIRLDKRVQPVSPSDVVSNQTAVGRVAVELVERENSPYLDSGRREIVRYVIDNVELSTDAVGEWSARTLPGARMHVYGLNAAGDEITASVAVPTDTVSVLPMYRVPDNYGDDTSAVLLFDFEKAFAQAGNSLDALSNVRGYFDFRLTLSPIREILRPAMGDLPDKELVGQPITVNDQPAVEGAGLVGHAWIRSYDPDPPPDLGYPDEEPAAGPGAGS